MGNKKRLTAFLSGLAIVFLLAACSGEKTSSTTTSGGKSNEKLSQGVTKDEILIGHSAPQTGPVAIYDAYRKGMDTYFQYVNENGGVNGRKIKLVAYDDQYQPTKAAQNAKKLVEQDKVFAVVGNMCSACLLATKDYYSNKGIPIIMIGSGLKAFVDPPINNWYGSQMMNYEVESQIMLDYAVKKLGAKRIAIAYQNDDFGKAPYNKLKEIIKDYPGVEIVAEVNYLPADTEFSSQAKKLSEAKPDTVFNYGTMGPVVNLKKAMYKIGLDKPNYIVSSVAGSDEKAFELAGAKVWEGTYSSGVTLSTDDVNNSKVKLFLEKFKKAYPNETALGAAEKGWGSAQILAEALKRTGKDLTWDNFFKALNTFNNWDGSVYEGITFSAKNHYGITKMFATRAQHGKIEKITDSILLDPETGKITMPK